MNRFPFGDDIRRTLLVAFTIFAVLPVLVAIAFMTRTADQAIDRTAHRLTEVGSETIRESAGRVASTGQSRLRATGDALQAIARGSLEQTSEALISSSEETLKDASRELIDQGAKSNRQLSESLIALSQHSSTELSRDLIRASREAGTELGLANERLAERALVKTTDQLVDRTQVLTGSISQHLISQNKQAATRLSERILRDVEKEPVVNFKTLATIFAQGIAGGKVLPIPEGYLAVVDRRGRVIASTKHRKGSSLSHLSIVQQALEGSGQDELVTFSDGEQRYLGVFARRDDGGAVVFAYLADKARMDTERMKHDVRTAIDEMGQRSSGYVAEALAANMPAIRREATTLSREAIATIQQESRASTQRSAQQMQDRAEAAVRRSRERMAAEAETVTASNLKAMQGRSQEILSRAIARMEPLATRSVAVSAAAMQAQAEKAVSETAQELAREVESSGARAVERMPPAAKVTAAEARSQLLFIAGILLGVEVALLMLLSMVLSGKIAAPILTERQRAKEEQDRLKRELEIASQIQLSMLPQVPPQIDGLDIAFYFQPADEVGGDYYDLIRVRERYLAIAVGDVNGHGLGAALLMAMAKSSFHTQAGRDPDVGSVMSGLNEMVFGASSERRFMTFFYALIDLETRAMVYSNAGHHYPYQLESQDGRLTSLQPSAYPLGVRQNTVFPVRNATIQGGDLLVFYSDGIIEARNSAGEEFGFERFEQLIWLNQAKTASDIKAEILRSLQDHQGSLPQEDDVTLVVLKFAA